MDKKKPVITWKTINDHHTDTREEQPSHQEHAASSENRDSYNNFPAAKRNKSVIHDLPINRKQTRNRRSIIISIAMAIMVGVGLGFFMLNMFTKLDSPSLEKDSTAVNTSARAKGTDSQLPKTETTVPALSAFVLQAGVFSTRENAETWLNKYQQAGFPAMIWERKGKYFLLAGIASSEKQAKSFAAKFTELDIFVKPWDTTEVQKKYNDAEKKWLLTFTEQWKKSLHTITANDTFSMKEWKKFLDSAPGSNKEISRFHTQLLSIGKDVEQTNSTSEQIILLKQWFQYEKYILQ